MIPEEILRHIDSKSLYFYQTCKYFYYYINIYYESKVIDAKYNRYIQLLSQKTAGVKDASFTDTVTIGDLLIVNTFISQEYIDYCYNHLYILDNYKFNFTLPSQLTHLTIDNSYNDPIDILPNSLIYLKLGDKFNQYLTFPPNLKTLILGNSYNKVLSELPELIHLQLGRHDQPLPKLPKLKFIKFGCNFDQSIKELPSSLTHIIFGYRFKQPLLNLPPNLLELDVGYNYNHPLPILPDSLKILKIGKHYTHDIIFPYQLRKLVYMSDKKIDMKLLPVNLKYLCLSKRYIHPFNINDVPNLKYLQIGLDKIKLDLYR